MSIRDPLLALKEMNRVLKFKGGYLVGTPNRSRLISSLGCSDEDANFKRKIKTNLRHWKARVRGKFRNEFGAHAGFSSQELCSLLMSIFSETKEITNDYYFEVYKNNTSDSFS